MIFGEPYKKLEIFAPLFLAFLTGWGYLLAHAYEVGFINYYGIPSDFAEVKLIPAIIAIIINAIWFTVFCLATFLVGIRRATFLKSLYRLILINFFLQFVPYFYLFENRDLHFVSILFISYVVIIPLLFALAIQAANRAYKNFQINGFKSVESKVQAIAVMVLVITSILLLTLYSAANAGHKNAAHRKFYPTIQLQKKLVIIRSYSDIFLAVPVLDNKLEINNFSIINKLDESYIDIKVEELGPYLF